MGSIAETPMELLLADSSRAHLSQVALHPTAGAPGCPVESPFGCVAVRRGSAVVFESSESLNACPKLQGRSSGPCSAVCVPVAFMGKSLGVLHATAADHEPLAADAVAKLTTLAAQAGSRIGTVRAFAQSQLQATTDGLTGLLNRRTLENELRSLAEEGRPFVVAMVDLDHFKVLNDTYGHEAGDRALRLLSRTFQEVLRASDIVARYGGEEFVLIFPDTTIVHATGLLDRLRVMLAAAIEGGDAPMFTASFGVADSAWAGTIDELLRMADEALMLAKNQGRNRVVVAAPGKPAVDVSSEA